MVSRRLTSPGTPFHKEEPTAARLLGTAQRLLFTYGYQAFTMDELAHELGMSKKTLYRHFPGKDAIVEKIIDHMAAALHGGMDKILSDPNLKFTEKISGIVSVAGSTIAQAGPVVLRDLQRFAPALYDKIEAVRLKVIPLVFGQLIRSGIAEGKVRADVDPAFATEFWLHAIRGLVQPAVLERTGLTIPQTLEKALHLFFNGLLTPAGRKDYQRQPES